MRSVLSFVIAVTLFLLQPVAYGQHDSTFRLQFKAGVYYTSRLHYYGRTDSLQSSAIFPLVELWFGRHVYVNTAPVFLNNARQTAAYAGTIATAGYQFNDQKKWSGNFYVARPFYKINTGLVQAVLKAQAAGSLTLHTPVINITTGGDLKFSGKIDPGATAALDHLFRIELPEKMIIVIDPSFTINAGTQQFAKSYYKQSNFLLFQGPEQLVTETVKKFNVLSYEATIPVVIAKGRLKFLVIPAYVLPQNLVTVADHPELSERGKDLFNVTVGAKVEW